MADRQAAAAGHARAPSLRRHVDEVARALQPEPLEPGDDVRRRLAGQDRRAADRVGLVGLGAVGEQPPAPVLDRDRAPDLGLEVVDDLLQVGHARQPYDARRWTSSSWARGSAGSPRPMSCSERGARVRRAEAERRRRRRSRPGSARIFRIAHASTAPVRAGAGGARRAGARGSASSACTCSATRGSVVARDGHAGAGRCAAADRDEPRARRRSLRDDVRRAAAVLRLAGAAAIWDPLAGALRIRRDARPRWPRAVDVRRATVTTLDDARGRRGRSSAPGSGRRRSCPLGLDLELTLEPHVRVTYDAGDGAPCVISPELLRAARSAHRPLRDRDARPAAPRRTMFGRSRPVERVECVSLFAPWLDAHGDGFIALRAGRVTALGAQQPDEVRRRCSATGSHARCSTALNHLDLTFGHERRVSTGRASRPTTGVCAVSLALGCWSLSLAFPAAASADDAIIVKRVPGLDRAERLAVRQDADVTLVDDAQRSRTPRSCRRAAATPTRRSRAQRQPGRRLRRAGRAGRAARDDP